MSVELHENEVPDLDNHGIVHVDQAGGVASSDLVVVYLAARTARTLVTHLPKVILHVSGNNVIFGHASLLPQFLGFQIGFEAKGWVTLKVCNIEP